MTALLSQWKMHKTQVTPVLTQVTITSLVVIYKIVHFVNSNIVCLLGFFFRFVFRQRSDSVCSPASLDLTVVPRLAQRDNPPASVNQVLGFQGLAPHLDPDITIHIL